ncbi:MAG: hypothetical protein EA397_15770 [Deltaproteobacteria bacterium]|nr:MAG: hypothetical protein EA397_15770 [Deltaproteobacteria bacterium]
MVSSSPSTPACLVLLLSLLLGPTSALAGPQTLSWELKLNGKPVGERTLTVSIEETDHGELRTLSADTQIDAKVIGVSFTYRQRLTANADRGPASFVSIVDQGGEVSEIQGRLTGAGWRMSIDSGGRTRGYDLAVNKVDLSTADLLDPHSRVPLARFPDEVSVLSAETGEVLAGRVEPLGPSSVTIKGQSVAVEGYALKIDQGAGTFFYTSEGWLVRFESKIAGQKVEGQLTEPPPKGVDDQPVDIFGGELKAVEL